MEGNENEIDDVDIDNPDERSPLNEDERCHLSDAKGCHVAYKSRWIVIVAQALISFSNGMMWSTFATIAGKTAKFYDVTEDSVNWLSLIFIIITIILVFPSSWFLEKFGLRITLNIVGALNVVAITARLLSTVLPGQQAYWLAFAGQIIAASGQGVLMIAPTKIAAVWFKEDQRTLANTIGTLSNTIGVMVISIMAPVFIDASLSDGMLNMTIAILVISIVGCSISLVFIRSATPPTPPSSSANVEHVPFCLAIRTSLKNRHFVLLAFSFGVGIAIFTSIMTMLQQILCTRGYSNTLVGVSGALLFACGIPGTAVASLYTDKTGRFDLAAKIAFGLCAPMTCLYAVVVGYSDIPVLVAMTMAAFGFVGFTLYPVCLELGVECTHPVPEAVSSGIIVMSGQVLSVVFILVMEALSVNEAADVSFTCDQDSLVVKDYTNSNIFLCSIASITAVIFISTFKCDFKRMETEKNEETDRILNRTLLNRSRNAIYS